MESKRSLEGVAYARCVFKDKKVQTDSKMIGDYLDRKICRTRGIRENILDMNLRNT